MAQSHISISETRWIIVNSTHFCNAWLAIIRVWINGGWVLECLKLFDRSWDPRCFTIFSVNDILLNIYKRDQDLGQTVSWRPEILLIFLVHIWVERSWIPENIAELPLHQSTIQVMLVISTKKNYFCLCAQLRGNAFVIHHKLQQIIFYPHKDVFKSKYFIAACKFVNIARSIYWVIRLEHVSLLIMNHLLNKDNRVRIYKQDR